MRIRRCGGLVFIQSRVVHRRPDIVSAASGAHRHRIALRVAPRLHLMQRAFVPLADHDIVHGVVGVKNIHIAAARQRKQRQNGKQHAKDLFHSRHLNEYSSCLPALQRTRQREPYDQACRRRCGSS